MKIIKINQELEIFFFLIIVVLGGDSLEYLQKYLQWMELENIILSKVSQAQKVKNHMFSFQCR
jgi:hypothetical protein